MRSRDKLEITSEASEVNAGIARSQASIDLLSASGQSIWDPTQLVPRSSSSGSRVGTQFPTVTDDPGVQCVAKLYFQGLEATLLCLYDLAGSNASNFRIVDTNDAFEKGNIIGLDIGHQVVHPLKDRMETDNNGNAYLGIRFHVKIPATRVLGKKLAMNEKQTKLTADEGAQLDVLPWFLRDSPTD